MQHVKSETSKTIIDAIPEALTQFDRLPDSAYINVKVVARLYGISVPSCWRHCKAQKMPPPIKISEGCTRWSVKSIRADLAMKAGVQ